MKSGKLNTSQKLHFVQMKQYELSCTKKIGTAELLV